MKTARQLLLEKKSFWGGLEGQFLSDELADLLNVPNNMNGYLVKSVAKGSPGDEAGLRGGTKVVTIDGQPVVLGGDIILSVDGIPATSPTNMLKVRDHLAGLKPGADAQGDHPPRRARPGADLGRALGDPARNDRGA